MLPMSVFAQSGFNLYFLFSETDSVGSPDAVLLREAQGNTDTLGTGLCERMCCLALSQRQECPGSVGQWASDDTGEDTVTLVVTPRFLTPPLVPPEHEEEDEGLTLPVGLDVHQSPYRSLPQ